MDGQEDQRRIYRLVSRTPRRNSGSQRRNMVHYRIENQGGTVAISNHFYVDINGVPLYPAPLPSSMPVTVYGHNQIESLPTTYVAIPPLHYIPPQATHIAIPLPTYAPPPIIVNANMPRNPGTSRIRNATGPRAGPARRIMNGTAPRALNGTASPIVRLPTPREPPVIQPQMAPPNAYVITPDGTYVTVPSSIYTPPPPAVTYAGMPPTPHAGTVTYAYENPSQRILPRIVPDSGRVRIVEEDVPSVDELQITEVDSSSTVNK